MEGWTTPLKKYLSINMFNERWPSKVSGTVCLRYRRDSPAIVVTQTKTVYLALISDTWSVIWPSVLAVPRISLRSFPAHSSPTFPASSRIWRIACSPASPENTTQRISLDTIHDQMIWLVGGVRADVSRWYGCLLPGWAFGSLSQFLAWAIFESIRPRALFMASVSFGLKRRNE